MMRHLFYGISTEGGDIKMQQYLFSTKSGIVSGMRFIQNKTLLNQ
jgi:hypothetical protein